MNKDIAVLTIPISPPNKEKLGIFTLCTVMDVLKAKINANGYLCLNMNDSYTDREIPKKKLMSDLEEIGFEGSSVWVDRDDQSHIVRNLEFLIDNNHVQKKNVTSLVCECGKVDCKADSLDHIQDKKIFKNNGDDIVCGLCDTVCVPTTKESLIFKIPDIKSPAKTIPNYLEKEIAELHKKFANQELMISKSRSTGLVFDYEGSSFNIDNDFCSFNYLSAFDEEKKVIIGGPRIAYQMYMIDLIEKICNPKSSVVFIPIARIGGDCSLNIHEEKPGLPGKKLFLMSAFNLAKDTKWPDGELDFVRNKPEELLSMIHDKLIEHSPPRECEPWDKYLERVVKSEMKFQNVKTRQIKKFKQQRM